MICMFHFSFIKAPVQQRLSTAATTRRQEARQVRQDKANWLSLTALTNSDSNLFCERLTHCLAFDINPVSTCLKGNRLHLQEQCYTAAIAAEITANLFFFFPPLIRCCSPPIQPYLPVAPHLAVFGRLLSLAATDLRHLLPVTDINLLSASSPHAHIPSCHRRRCKQSRSVSSIVGKSMGNLSFHHEKRFGWDVVDKQKN